jgi:hypothetical protein
MQAAGIDMVPMTANRFERYCQPLQDVLWDNSRSLLAVQNACRILDLVISGKYDRDTARNSTIQSRASDLIRAEHGTNAAHTNLT